jgi:peptidylprolyl isomerase
MKIGPAPFGQKWAEDTSALAGRNLMIRLLVLLAAMMINGSVVLAQQLTPGLDPRNAIFVDTKFGRIVIKLRNDIAPRHAERMKLLAREKFYDNVPFHRVIPGLMAQTGDGGRGDGTGGSKYPNLLAEFSNVPFKRGTVGMARANDPNSANSQFFIMFAEADFLNGKYTVVGKCSPAWRQSTRSRRANRWSIPTA